MPEITVSKKTIDMIEILADLKTQFFIEMEDFDRVGPVIENEKEIPHEKWRQALHDNLLPQKEEAIKDYIKQMKQMAKVASNNGQLVVVAQNEDSPEPIAITIKEQKDLDELQQTMLSNRIDAVQSQIDFLMANVEIRKRLEGDELSPQVASELIRTTRKLVDSAHETDSFPPQFLDWHQSEQELNILEKKKTKSPGDERRIKELAKEATEFKKIWEATKHSEDDPAAPEKPLEKPIYIKNTKDVGLLDKGKLPFALDTSHQDHALKPVDAKIFIAAHFSKPQENTTNLVNAHLPRLTSALHGKSFNMVG